MKNGRKKRIRMKRKMISRVFIKELGFYGVGYMEKRSASSSDAFADPFAGEDNEEEQQNENSYHVYFPFAEFSRFHFINKEEAAFETASVKIIFRF